MVGMCGWILQHSIEIKIKDELIHTRVWKVQSHLSSEKIYISVPERLRCIKTVCGACFLPATQQAYVHHIYDLLYTVQRCKDLICHGYSQELHNAWREDE